RKRSSPRALADGIRAKPCASPVRRGGVKRKSQDQNVVNRPRLRQALCLWEPGKGRDAREGKIGRRLKIVVIVFGFAAKGDAFLTVFACRGSENAGKPGGNDEGVDTIGAHRAME